MSNKKKESALRQIDPYRVPKSANPRLRKAAKKAKKPVRNIVGEGIGATITDLPANLLIYAALFLAFAFIIEKIIS